MGVVYDFLFGHYPIVYVAKLLEADDEEVHKGPDAQSSQGDKLC